MDFKPKKSNHHYVGALGEAIAKRYLEKKGYRTIAQNYRKKWGEIDIIMSKKNRVHFVEVKTVSRKVESGEWRVENTKDRYRPEDNMHPWKVKRIYRAVESYLGESKGGEKDWQIDLVSVYLDEESKMAKVELLENIF